MPITVPDPISSVNNDRLRWVRRLVRDRKARRREGVWTAEGVRLGEEVCASGLPVRLWVLEAVSDDVRRGALEARIEARGDPVLRVRRGLLVEVADTRTPQGVIVVFGCPRWAGTDPWAGPGPTVILDRVQDPGNLGTIARSAEASGAAGLVVTPGCADPGSPKAQRAAAGSLLRVPLVRVDDPLAAARKAGLPVFATAGTGGTPYDRFDLSDPHALVLGREGSGVGPTFLEGADGLLTVPMAGGVESLNVAATAAVILFEAARQRRTPRPQRES